MKKKIFVLFFLMLFLVSCNGFSSTTTTKTTEEIYTATEKTDLELRLIHLYELALEAEAFEGTYEEWLESVRGPQGVPGKDGREVLLQISDDYFQWKYIGDAEWTNLIEISMLTGIQGVGILYTEINQYGELIITYTDSTEANLGVINMNFTVNFIGKDGYLISSQLVIDNGDAIAPTPPILEGYTFVGWDIEYTSVSANLIVTAIYEKNTYTITFDTDGGEAIDPITGIEYDSSIELPIATKEGYIFKGWFTGTTINDGHFTNQMTVKHNLTLYARWENEVFSVKFIGIDGTVLKESIVSLGDSATPPEIPEVIGYTFNGWQGSYDNIIKDTIIKAIYSINQYSATYVVFDYDYDTLLNIPLYPGETIIDVSLGQYYSSAITSEGRIFTWGYNSSGQLGDGTTTDRYTPINITAQFDLNEGETLIQLSSGSEHSSAITSEGRIFTWGNNFYGQLGDGTTINCSTPNDITSQFPLNEEEIIVKVSLGGQHSLAMTSEGRIFMWGNNNVHQLGFEGGNIENSPVYINWILNLNEGETVTQVSLGYQHSSVLTSECRIFMWGNDYYGQLGDGLELYFSTAVEITSQFPLNVGETIIEVSLGYNHSSAITSEGRIFIWGKNLYGQLGDGTINNQNVPIEITSQFSLNIGETIIHLFLGDHSSAISSEGRIFTWGNNSVGQLGDGTIIDKTTPVEITTQFNLDIGETIVVASLGHYHSSAITSEGKIFTWGRNYRGQLGDGTTTDNANPTTLSFYTPELYNVIFYDFNESLDYMPVLEGYIFDGWYLDTELTILFTSTTMPAENIVLFGKWIIV